MLENLDKKELIQMILNLEKENRALKEKIYGKTKVKSALEEKYTMFQDMTS